MLTTGLATLVIAATTVSALTVTVAPTSIPTPPGKLVAEEVGLPISTVAVRPDPSLVPMVAPAPMPMPPDGLRAGRPAPEDAEPLAAAFEALAVPTPPGTTLGTTLVGTEVTGTPGVEPGLTPGVNVTAPGMLKSKLMANAGVAEALDALTILPGVPVPDDPGIADATPGETEAPDALLVPAAADIVIVAEAPGMFDPFEADAVDAPAPTDPDADELPGALAGVETLAIVVPVVSTTAPVAVSTAEAVSPGSIEALEPPGDVAVFVAVAVAPESIAALEPLGDVAVLAEAVPRTRRDAPSPAS
jgi:hypothetical protein